MYFLSETDGEVTTITCAISGKYWRYHNGSETARRHAVNSATSFQNTLLGTLVNEEHLTKSFYTLPELEAAYARLSTKRSSVQGEQRPRRWVS